MIIVKHPLAFYRKNQEHNLKQLPESERPLYELMYSVGNATFKYHTQAKEFVPTLQDYQDWLSGLEPEVRLGMSLLGFNKCKSILSFTRYVMEKNDVGLEEYIKMQLGDTAYSEYKKLSSKENGKIVSKEELL